MTKAHEETFEAARTRARRSLARAIVATSIVTLGLAWLATRPSPRLEPLRSTAFELDEPTENARPAR